MAKKDEQSDAGAEQVREQVAAEQEQGFRGTSVDPTPNENYTVAGVTSGAPTPENDEAARREAADRAEQVARGAGSEADAK